MPTNYNIDKVDRQILTFLIEDARTPFTEIAKKLNISPGTVHGRVKKMEQRRIITGATLSINYDVVGYGFTAYVGLILGRTIDSEKIIKALKDIPEITVAHIATGKFSIFCKPNFRKDLNPIGLMEKLRSVRMNLPNHAMDNSVKEKQC